MCIPPANEKSYKYFKEMSLLKKKLNLEELSMGMSSDYLEAVENHSTYLPPDDLWCAHYKLHEHNRVTHDEVMLLQTIGVNLSNNWGSQFPIDVERSADYLSKFSIPS